MTAFQFRRVVTFVEVGGEAVHVDQPAVADTDKANLTSAAEIPQEVFRDVELGGSVLHCCHSRILHGVTHGFHLSFAVRSCRFLAFSWHAVPNTRDYTPKLFLCVRLSTPFDIPDGQLLHCRPFYASVKCFYFFLLTAK